MPRHDHDQRFAASLDRFEAAKAAGHDLTDPAVLQRSTFNSPI